MFRVGGRVFLLGRVWLFTCWHASVCVGPCICVCVPGRSGHAAPYISFPDSDSAKLLRPHSSAQTPLFLAVCVRESVCLSVAVAGHNLTWLFELRLSEREWKYNELFGTGREL